MATYNPGVWYSKNDFEDFRVWCKNNNKSFFAFYTNETGGCGYCTSWNSNCLSKSEFISWMSTSNIYYCKCDGGTYYNNVQKAIKEDCGMTASTQFPFGYFYKSSSFNEIFHRPATNQTTSNNRSRSWIRTPSELINLLKQYEIVKFTVTFKDWNGTTLKTQDVEKGQSASPPPDPSRSGYKFIGWNTSYTNIQSNTTCTAQYEQIQQEKDQAKLILQSDCFGRKHDVNFLCSDGVTIYYLYPEKLLKKSLSISISFNGNGQTSGSQSDVTTTIRQYWTCPQVSYSKSGYKFVSWNSRADGSGTAYVPGTSYYSPLENQTLYAQWQVLGKIYAVLAGYSSSSSQDSLNSVSTNEIEKIVSNYSQNITKLNGSAAKPKAILDAINDALSKDDCKFLYIFLCGHGNRDTISGQECTYIAYNSGNLTGVSLWNALKDAKCKVFVNIHTCHAGSFFRSINPYLSIDTDNSYINASSEIIDDKPDFIGDARKFFNELKAKRKENNLFAASANGEPKMLLWSSNSADEYGWMVNSPARNSNPVWFEAYGEVGTGLEISLKNNFSKNKTYNKWWADSTKPGEASRQNPAYIKGTKEYNVKKYMDGGPNPMKDAYGGFDQDEIIFTI